MTDVAVSDLTATVETYFAMWNETDPAKRREHIAQVWTAEGRYVDPLSDAQGYDALNTMVESVQQQYPGHRFHRTSGLDQHHDQLRFGWALVAPDGSTLAAGIDAGAVAGDGRLTRITGFFGELPTA